ncbi:MAG TPA: GntR family transcriptional regulator [Stellaceae bacterium]|nr:GntR family transcriptional regulator [Stellaceae bacterium]
MAEEAERQAALGYPQSSARYAALARTLLADIQDGRYGVGSQLPTELELCERFNVSRHTVRQALRELRDLGVISARQGVGTLVRGLPAQPKLVHDAASVEDLLLITRQTRMKVLERADIVADERLATLLPCSPGQQWISLSMLRFLPSFTIPVAHLIVYIRPEFGGIIPRIETADLPIFRLIEQEYGQRLAEIRQEITATALGEVEARAVSAEPGYPALQVLRRFYDERDRLTQMAIANYPGDRFTHTATFRLKRGVD